MVYLMMQALTLNMIPYWEQECFCVYTKCIYYEYVYIFIHKETRTVLSVGKPSYVRFIASTNFYISSLWVQNCACTNVKIINQAKCSTLDLEGAFSQQFVAEEQELQPLVRGGVCPYRQNVQQNGPALSFLAGENVIGELVYR